MNIFHGFHDGVQLSTRRLIAIFETELCPFVVSTVKLSPYFCRAPRSTPFECIIESVASSALCVGTNATTCQGPRHRRSRWIKPGKQNFYSFGNELFDKMSDQRIPRSIHRQSCLRRSVETASRCKTRYEAQSDQRRKVLGTGKWPIGRSLA